MEKERDEIKVGDIVIAAFSPKKRDLSIGKVFEFSKEYGMDYTLEVFFYIKELPFRSEGLVTVYDHEILGIWI